MIIRKPTKVVIENYELGDNSKLESSLSVWEPTTFSYTFSAFLYNEETKELTIPGGFSDSYLRKLFPDKKIVYKNNVTDVNKFDTIQYSLKYPPKNESQIQAINFLLGTKKTQKFLSLETGGGKTYCAINYIFKTKKKPIIFVDQEGLMLQWKEAFLRFTTLNSDEIYYISGKESINKLMKMKKVDINKLKIFICIHKTISSLIEREGFEQVDKLLSKIKIGLKVFDEAHVEYKNIFHIDASTNTESMYITATPSRSNHSEKKVYENMFMQVPIYMQEHNEDENYHNIIVTKYSSNPSITVQGSIKNQYGFSTSKWSNYILEDGYYDEFFTLLTKLIDTIAIKEHESFKTAILFNTSAGVSKLVEDLTEQYPDLSIGRFDSTIKDKNKRLKEWEKDIIVTTDKSFGKAIDVENLQVVIDTVPYGSEVVTQQTIGRLRRLPDKEVFYITMVDIGFKSCVNQLNKRSSIFKKIGKNIFNIDTTKK